MTGSFRGDAGTGDSNGGMTAAREAEHRLESSSRKQRVIELMRGGARILGDARRVSDLLAMLDHFPAWFPVATHEMKFGEK